AYDDPPDVRPIASPTADGRVTVQGEIKEMEGRHLASGGSVVSIVITDDGVNALEGVWFNQPRVASRYHFGQRVSFSGKPKWYRDHWQMANPRVQIVDGTSSTGPGILPIYPMTEDLPPDE